MIDENLINIEFSASINGGTWFIRLLYNESQWSGWITLADGEIRYISSL